LNRAVASVVLDVDGFSSRTCFPAFRDLTAHSKCRPLGRGMYTASIEGSFINSIYDKHILATVVLTALNGWKHVSQNRP